MGDHVGPATPLSANRPAVALAGVGSVGTSTVAVLIPLLHNPQPTVADLTIPTQLTRGP